ncbi:MAG: retron system putative HNH endonuclease [Planctomycetota bacterium]|jgi:uncharacterized protein (TIGR02646 family)
MRKVTRLSAPGPFEKGAPQWTKALLEKIQECERNGTRVPKRVYNRYRRDDVKERLDEMYRGLCCYCEGRIGVVEFGHIEHRMPKRKFPKHTYNWENLHLACTRCNVNKGTKYSRKYPILDAVKDEIAGYLTYEVDRRGVWPKARRRRGETTIRHVGLTDERLRANWNEVFNEAIGVIGNINQEGPDGAGVAKLMAELAEMRKDEYGSIVEYAVERYLRTQDV